MKTLLIAIILSAFTVSTITGATLGTVVAVTSDDYAGLNNNLATFGGTWLAGVDSTYASPAIGLSGAFYYFTALRFTLTGINNAATIDSAELWPRNGGNSVTDTVEFRVLAYGADAGIQVTDTAGARTAWASRNLSSGSIDTGYLATTVNWATAGTRYRLPANKLKGVIQAIVNRPGWPNGGTITIFIVPTSTSPANRRLTRNRDFGGGAAPDSLWVSYTNGTGGGGAPGAGTWTQGTFTKGTWTK